jgi:hypothetical protein
MLQADRQGRAIQGDSAGPKLTPLATGPLGGRKADAGACGATPDVSPQVARGLVSRACYGDPAGVAENANWLWSVPPDNAILSISSIRVIAN